MLLDKPSQIRLDCLSLPAEIRALVYKALFRGTVILANQPPSHPEPEDLVDNGIFQVCRKCNTEAKPLFFCTVRIKFLTPGDINSLVPRLGLSLLRNVLLEGNCWSNTSSGAVYPYVGEFRVSDLFPNLEELTVCLPYQTPLWQFDICYIVANELNNDPRYRDIVSRELRQAPNAWTRDLIRTRLHVEQQRRFRLVVRTAVSEWMEKALSSPPWLINSQTTKLAHSIQRPMIVIDSRGWTLRVRSGEKVFEIKQRPIEFGGGG